MRGGRNKSSNLSEVQQQQNLEQQMLQRLPQQEAVLQLQEVVRDLSILDESLRSLFNGSAPGQEAQHEQLVYFRGRVARRISRYTLLVRKLTALVDRLLKLQEEKLLLLHANSSQTLPTGLSGKSGEPSEKEIGSGGSGLLSSEVTGAAEAQKSQL
ncbi:sec20 protein, partial [Cystoisospora suis]